MILNFIIPTAISILGKALKAKPDSKLAKILLDEKVRNTVQDIYAYYVLLEMEAIGEDTTEAE
jgi:hypothetical protein